MTYYCSVKKAAGPSPLTGRSSDGLLIHEKAVDLPQLPVGSFARLPSGRILSMAGKPGRFHVSDNDGRDWEERPLPGGEPEVEPSPSGALVCTRDGTVVAAFADLKQRHWPWDDALKDAPGARLPTYVMRSSDEGESWQDVQKLHDEWTGATRDMIQTAAGDIVLCTMKMQHDPGRHSVLTYLSGDDGRTWEASNVLDLGGNGHHDGVTEGTVVELKDGRLLQYLRTNWGQFWRAESADGGRRWHPYGPTGVEASSAPAMLTRLASGRIALVWNRPAPEGSDVQELRGGDGVWSATPASNYREELSISFSEDEGSSWSAPVVLARNPGGEVSYPCTFEPEPGRLWVTTWRWLLRIEVREDDFLR